MGSSFLPANPQQFSLASELAAEAAKGEAPEPCPDVQSRGSFDSSRRADFVLTSRRQNPVV